MLASAKSLCIYSMTSTVYDRANDIQWHAAESTRKLIIPAPTTRNLIPK